MLWVNEARRATLATFRRALTEGASEGVAAQVAYARYRAFFPAAGESEAKRALQDAISVDDLLKSAASDKRS